MLLRIMIMVVGVAFAGSASAFSLYGPGSGINYTGFVNTADGVGFSWPWAFVDTSASYNTQASFASFNTQPYQPYTTSPFIPSAQQAMTLYQAPRQLISPLNHKPVFIPLSNQTVRVGQSIQFAVQAYDVDSPYLRYSATDLPHGAQFNEYTHSFYWVPDMLQMGRYTVYFRVSDMNNYYVEMPIAITVTDQNGFLPLTACGAGPGPYVYNFTPPRTVKAGELYAYKITGASGNNNALSYRVIDGPPSFKIDEKTGYITWLVAFNQSGAMYPVRIAADNGQCEMSYNFTIMVK